jgi:hypothetical protein
MGLQPRDRVGRYYELTHDIITQDGVRLPAGTYVRVVEATPMRLVLQTETCRCCGLSYKYTVTRAGKYAGLRPLGTKPPFRGSEAGL